jgi:cyclopropane-fatty-acyl-phospholipid synthase
MDAKQTIERLLTPADIRIGGDRPWDITVHDERFFERVLGRSPELELGESYMEGWWDVPRLDQFFHRLLAARVDERVQRDWRTALELLPRLLLNPGRRSRAFEIGRRHYDIGNDLYRAMLDARLTYTCGYWRDADTLDAAQEAKLELVCRKIGLQPGMRVLDIGGGWGSFAGYAAERHGAEVVAITVSERQVEVGRELTAGLPVELRLQDYRDVPDGPYDRIVSLGMVEHVGYKNYRTYLEVARRLLVPDGLFLLHTIGSNVSARGGDAWTERYIFPNSMLPSLRQLSGAAERLFVIEDLHNFGADYDATLMAWHANVEAGWERLGPHYDERFRRMWRYYLLSNAGSFRARRNQLWQLMLSPTGVIGGYRSIR